MFFRLGSVHWIGKFKANQYCGKIECSKRHRSFLLSDEEKPRIEKKSNATVKRKIMPSQCWLPTCVVEVCRLFQSTVKRTSGFTLVITLDRHSFSWTRTSQTSWVLKEKESLSKLLESIEQRKWSEEEWAWRSELRISLSHWRFMFILRCTFGTSPFHTIFWRKTTAIWMFRQTTIWISRGSKRFWARQLAFDFPCCVQKKQT